MLFIVLSSSIAFAQDELLSTQEDYLPVENSSSVLVVGSAWSEKNSNGLRLPFI